MTVNELKVKIERTRKTLKTSIENIIDLFGADVEDIRSKRRAFDAVSALADDYILDFAHIITNDTALLDMYLSMVLYGLRCSDDVRKVYATSEAKEVKQ